jgi:hypothetical protein
MNFLNDDKRNDTPPRQEPRQESRREAECLSNPVQVILDIRKDIEKFRADEGPRKEMVEALKDQFLATRHQAGVKAEAVRMLALDMLRDRLHEIKTVPELLRVISTLSRISESDLAAICGGGMVSGTGALLNIQQLTLHDARSDNPSVNLNRGASHVLESFELLNKIIKERA